jgi:hypothetical protein
LAQDRLSDVVRGLRCGARLFCAPRLGAEPDDTSDESEEPQADPQLAAGCGSRRNRARSRGGSHRALIEAGTLRDELQVDIAQLDDIACVERDFRDFHPVHSDAVRALLVTDVEAAVFVSHERRMNATDGRVGQREITFFAATDEQFLVQQRVLRPGIWTLDDDQTIVPLHRTIGLDARGNGLRLFI